MVATPYGGSLGDARREFTALVAKLIQFINASGYGCALEECKRTDEQSIIHAMGPELRAQLADYLDDDPRWQGLALAVNNNGRGKGIVMSNHRIGLAVDVSLYKDGEYLPTTEAHRHFGTWWEEQHMLARWGGRFGDGNHYSFVWQGRE